MYQEESFLKDVLNKIKTFKFGKIGLIIGIVLAILIINPFVIIPAGHRGVILNFGAVSNKVLGEGIHFVTPIVQSTVKIDVRVQKSTTKSDAASKDLQQVQTEIALNWHLSDLAVNEVYQRVGADVQFKIIDPAVQEATKAITAKYTAEQLISQRELVSTGIKEILKERLEKYSIVLDEFSILDFAFSKSFNEAIEAKQTAEQDALRAERDIERIRNEAESRVLKARSEATELMLKRQQLTPLMVQKEWIEKWDGKLPNFVSGGQANVLMQMGAGQQ